MEGPYEDTLYEELQDIVETVKGDFETGEYPSDEILADCLWLLEDALDTYKED